MGIPRLNQNARTHIKICMKIVSQNFNPSDAIMHLSNRFFVIVLLVLEPQGKTVNYVRESNQKSSLFVNRFVRNTNSTCTCVLNNTDSIVLYIQTCNLIIVLRRKKDTGIARETIGVITIKLKFLLYLLLLTLAYNNKQNLFFYQESRIK